MNSKVPAAPSSSRTRSANMLRVKLPLTPVGSPAANSGWFGSDLSGFIAPLAVGVRCCNPVGIGPHLRPPECSCPELAPVMMVQTGSNLVGEDSHCQETADTLPSGSDSSAANGTPTWGCSTGRTNSPGSSTLLTLMTNRDGIRAVAIVLRRHYHGKTGLDLVIQRSRPGTDLTRARTDVEIVGIRALQGIFDAIAGVPGPWPRTGLPTSLWVSSTNRVVLSPSLNSGGLVPAGPALSTRKGLVRPILEGP